MSTQCCTEVKQSQSFNVAWAAAYCLIYVHSVSLGGEDQKDLPIPIKHNILLWGFALWENSSRSAFKPSSRLHCFNETFKQIIETFCFFLSVARDRRKTDCNLWWSLASHNKLLKDKRKKVKRSIKITKNDFFDKHRRKNTSFNECFFD